MSSIRSRRRWIRVQLVVLAGLFTVLIFPSAPRTVRRALASTPIIQKSHAHFELMHIKHRIEEGDISAYYQLAWLYDSDQGYHRYFIGDPAEVLQPMIDDGDINATFSLAILIRDSDPKQASNLFLRAADLGDYRSQVFYLRNTGFEATNTSEYMRRLHQLQKDRPGWKISFNRAYTVLLEQADLGNTDAQQILDELETIVYESDT